MRIGVFACGITACFHGSKPLPNRLAVEIKFGECLEMLVCGDVEKFLPIFFAHFQAVATARRLGAIVEVSDIREVVEEQVKSLGGKFIELPSTESGEGEGGCAVRSRLIREPVKKLLPCRPQTPTATACAGSDAAGT